MLNPKLNDLFHLIVSENSDTVRGPEQAMSHNDFTEIFVRLIFCEPVFKRVLEYMCGDLHGGGKFLERPMLEFLCY